ncbi:MAG: orotidine-5'-phosphate decarboxylase [Eubacteriales bacterium]|jgi:orotidine-5'-phosphate decarboxylase
MGKDVIIACDFPGVRECLDFLEKFNDRRPYIKIGMELYYATGPDLVRELKSRGYRIFLDLKLHDIPNTVRRASAVLGRLGVDMLNVHAAGGSAMMAAAVEGIAQSDSSTKLIAVTQLTSISPEVLKGELLIDKPLDMVVQQYAKNAKAAGLAGVVCSPLEAGVVHATCGSDFLTITPGVRFAGGEAGDQRRVTTPAMARELGSDYIVVGRPITCAADPVAAYDRCVREFIG